MGGYSWELTNQRLYEAKNFILGTQNVDTVSTFHFFHCCNWCSSDFAPPLVSQQPNVIAGVACHLIYQHHLCSYSQCTDGSWGILGYVRMPHLSSVLKPPRPRPWCMCIRCFLLFIWCTSKPTDYMHSRGGGGSDSRCTQENLLSEMVWYINTHTHVR